MTIKEYIQKNYGQIRSKVLAVTKGHECSDDLLNDLILSLLEKDNDYKSQLINDDKIQQWIVKSAHIQFNSSTSPFHKNYRKRNIEWCDTQHEQLIVEHTTESHYREDLKDDVKIYISNLPIDKRTYAQKHFIDGVSQRKMADYYGINRLHIGNDLSNIKKNIKVKFNLMEYKKRYE